MSSIESARVYAHIEGAEMLSPYDVVDRVLDATLAGLDADAAAAAGRAWLADNWGGLGEAARERLSALGDLTLDAPAAAVRGLTGLK